jgi:hypothetical protein
MKTNDTIQMEYLLLLLLTTGKNTYNIFCKNALKGKSHEKRGYAVAKVFRE